MGITQQRGTALFDDGDVKQCLCEEEAWIQLLVATRNHLLESELSPLIASLCVADSALSHFK